MAIQIYFPTNSLPGFLFLHILTVLVFFFFFIIASLTDGDNISLWFWFVLPWWLVILSTFPYACLPSVCLWSHVYSCPLSIFNQVIYLLLCCMHSLYILNINPLLDICGFFFPFVLIVSFAVQKISSLMWSPCLTFVFVACSFVLLSKKSLLRDQCQVGFSYAFS